MAEHTEREAEKLLRAAAEARRREAGSPKMHPATREILRTEVRRRYGRERRHTKTRAGWWLRMLPKVAVFVILGAGAWILFLREEDPGAPTLAFREEKSQRPLQEAAAEPAPEADTRLDNGLSRSGNERLPTAPSTSVAVKSSPTAFSDAGLAKSEGAPEASAVGADYLKSDRQSMYVGTATVKRQQDVSDREEEAQTYAALLQPQDDVRNEGRSRSGPANAIRLEAPLSQRFTVLNDGMSLRLIDADGSTYVGSLVPAEGSVAEMDAAEGTLDAGDGTRTSPRSAVGDELALVTYRVVASGTNRTLGRSVRFEGNLMLTEQQIQLGRNGFSNTIAPVAGGRLLNGVPVRDGAFPGRLQGTATLEDGQDLRVDAVPTR
jgi:hypothetical protein